MFCNDYSYIDAFINLTIVVCLLDLRRCFAFKCFCTAWLNDLWSLFQGCAKVEGCITARVQDAGIVHRVYTDHAHTVPSVQTRTRWSQWIQHAVSAVLLCLSDRFFSVWPVGGSVCSLLGMKLINAVNLSFHFILKYIFLKKLFLNLRKICLWKHAKVLYNVYNRIDNIYPNLYCFLLIKVETLITMRTKEPFVNLPIHTKSPNVRGDQGLLTKFLNGSSMWNMTTVLSCTATCWAAMELLLF